MTDDSRKQLEDIRFLIRSNVEVIKPMFGVMFWQLTAIEGTIKPEEIGQQGMHFAMTEEDDEVLASFMAAYIKVWENADDLNAASRFVANSLGMTADELLQTRQIYLDRCAAGNEAPSSGESD